LGDPDVDGRIILKWMFMQSSGKNVGNYLTSCKDWLPSQERLCSIE
jgi:hypothetical protein